MSIHPSIPAAPGSTSPVVLDLVKLHDAIPRSPLHVLNLQEQRSNYTGYILWVIGNLKAADSSKLCPKTIYFSIQ